MVCRQTDNHSLHLQPKTDVKIFRDMCIGPPLGLAVRLVDDSNALQGFPPKECVVADKRCDITGANAILDGSVNDVGKVGYFFNVSEMSKIGDCLK